MFDSRRVVRKLARSVAFHALVLCSAVAAFAQPRYVVSEYDDGNTVVDHVTGLRWEQTSATLQVQWQAALQYCEGLVLGGSDNWRLPNVIELSTLVDETRSNPPLNTVYFVDFVNGAYWTSTTNPLTSQMAYIVNFYDSADELANGGINIIEKTSTANVLCVRTF